MKKEKTETAKPRNPVARSPLMKKGHAHLSDRDYNRPREKSRLKKEQFENSN